MPGKLPHVAPILIIALASLAFSCASSPPSIEGRGFPIDTGTLRYLSPCFPRAEVEKDLVYAEATSRSGERVSLRLDAYQPSGDKAPLRPGLLWIHGGGLYMGDKDSGASSFYPEAMARRGYVCFSIDYRLAERPIADQAAAARDALNDADAAVRWIEAHAAEYRLDPDRLAVAGESAGGYLAMRLAYPGEGTNVGRTPLLAVVDFFGAGLPPELRGTAVPVLQIHGDHDSLEPISAAYELDRRLRRRGIPRELFVMRGEGHNSMGTYRDENLDRICHFLYARLTGGDRSEWAASANRLEAFPGEDICLEMKRPRRAGNRADVIRIAMPQGWTLISDPAYAADRLDERLIIRVPIDEPPGYAALALGSADSADILSSATAVSVRVKTPLGMSMNRAPGGREQWSCKLSNLSSSSTLSGKALLESSGRGKSVPLAFRDMRPSSTATFTLEMQGYPSEEAQLLLDQGFSGSIRAEVEAYPIPRISGMITIDGDLSDWPAQPLFSLDRRSQTVMLEDWSGPEYLSSRNWLAWDETRLYLAAEVRSQDFVQDHVGADIYEGDGIQLGLDAREKQAPLSSEYNEIGLAFSEATGRTELFRWIAPRGQQAGAIDGIEAIARRDGGITVYEAAIPWAIIGAKPEQIASGKRLRLAFLVNHIAPDGHRGWMEWGSGIGFAKDSTQFRTMILE
jgi:Esterase/lipase